MTLSAILARSRKPVVPGNLKKGKPPALRGSLTGVSQRAVTTASATRQVAFPQLLPREACQVAAGGRDERAATLSRESPPGKPGFRPTWPPWSAGRPHRNGPRRAPVAQRQQLRVAAARFRRPGCGQQFTLGARSLLPPHGVRSPSTSVRQETHLPPPAGSWVPRTSTLPYRPFAALMVTTPVAADGYTVSPCRRTLYRREPRA